MVEAILAVVGVLGTAVAFVLSRLDQRNKRTLLDRDLTLIEKAKDYPQIQRPLVDLATHEARALARSGLRSSLRSDGEKDLWFGLWLIVVSGSVFGAGALLELVIFGEFPYRKPTPRGQWVPDEVAQAVHAVILIAAGVLSVSILLWLFSLTMFRRKLRGRRANGPHQPGSGAATDRPTPTRPPH